MKKFILVFVLFIFCLFEIKAQTNNTVYGNQAGASLTTGSTDNSLFGASSGYSLTSDQYCTFEGSESGKYTTGNENVFIGYSAGYGSIGSTAQNNTFIGTRSGFSITTGGGNVFLGRQAGMYSTTARHNVFLGQNAGAYNISGEKNVFIGYRAGYNETDSNKLYIANSEADEDEALIYGEFDNDLLRINGNLDLRQSMLIGKEDKKFLIDARPYYDGDLLYIAPQTTSGWGSSILTLHRDGIVDIPNKLHVGSEKPTSASNYYNDYIFSVSGTALFKEVVVTTDNWADFVFDENYNLKSYTELEEYIKKNNHLPDVPAENEIYEKGINLGEMNAILLQKIEELTLYVIDLHKENENLKQDINTLLDNQ